MFLVVIGRMWALAGFGIYRPLVYVKQAKRRKALRAERVAANQCRDCGKERQFGDGGTVTRCPECADYHRKKRRQHKALGLCYGCGKKPMAGKTRCRTCIDKAKAFYAARFAARYAALVKRHCRRCGVPVGRYKQLCGTCSGWRQRHDRSHVTAIIYDHYGPRCAACGSTGKLEIDHVNDDGWKLKPDGSPRRSIEGERLAEFIVKSGFPTDYQLLCRPCNHEKYCRYVAANGLIGRLKMARCDEHGRPERRQ